MSFMRFLGLTISDDIPDSRTICHFTETLTDLNLVKDLFGKELERLGLIVNEGKIVDASFIEAPRQRNTREDNQKIKQGQGDDLWKDKPNKKRQKDIDARWTKKNFQNYYGYKNHAKVDAKNKLVDAYTVTNASVHDSQALDDLLQDQDMEQELFADSAYVGQEDLLEKHHVKDQIHEKGYKNKPFIDRTTKIIKYRKIKDTSKSGTCFWIYGKFHG